jgi:hypothetical protein
MTVSQETSVDQHVVHLKLVLHWEGKHVVELTKVEEEFRILDEHRHWGLAWRKGRWFRRRLHPVIYRFTHL